MCVVGLAGAATETRFDSEALKTQVKQTFTISWISFGVLTTKWA